MAKINYKKLETEYISTRISYRQLAKKHNLSERQIARYGKEHGWVEKRQQFVGKVAAKTQSALIQSETDKLLAICSAVDFLKDTVADALSDPQQLYTRVWFDAETGTATEYTTSKIDVSAVKSLAGALKDLASVVRDVYGIAAQSANNEININFVLPKGAEGIDN